MSNPAFEVFGDLPPLGPGFGEAAIGSPGGRTGLGRGASDDLSVDFKVSNTVAQEVEFSRISASSLIGGSLAQCVRCFGTLMSLQPTVWT